MADAGIDREQLPENLTEALIVYIARVSSSRTNKWDEHHKLIEFLIENAHWSPFEHAFITYEIETSRAIGRQLLRHRSFTFQEFSQRYAAATSFEEVELREQPEHNRQSSTEPVGGVYGEGAMYATDDESDYYGAIMIAQNALEKVMRAYRTLLDEGIATETARFLLPGATTTTIYMSGPLRSWIHFLDLRDDEHAQKEVRLIAQEIREDLSNLFPNVAKAAGFDESNS